MVGIVGYGAYIPRNRIKLETIAEVWGADAQAYKRGLLLYEKSVPSPDQDVITMTVESARHAIKRAGINPKDIGCCYVGSESHPYAVKPTGTLVAEAVGATPHVHVADFEFACKAGSESMFVAMSHVKANEMKYALCSGADTSQGAPGDALEYSASAGSAAFVMGKKKEEIIAECLCTHSWCTDTPDFWRREYQFYPRHAGRFTGEPAYFKHVLSCAREIMDMAKLQPKDFAHCVFHQPNGKFPQRASRMLGFKDEQHVTGWLSPWLGNTYSGASPMGLTAVLDIAKPGDLILMVSYGSGAGSDGFVWRCTDRLPKVQKLAPQTRTQLDKNKVYLSYGQYAKFRDKIKRAR